MPSKLRQSKKFNKREGENNQASTKVVLQDLETMIGGPKIRLHKGNKWSTVGEILLGEREPDNFEDYHAVCVRKDRRVVGHLERGVSGRFTQPVNLGDNLGMKVPYKIVLTDG